MSRSDCPVCSNQRVQSGWSFESPVLGTFLLESAEAALNVPTGRIALASCEGCGFVFNTAFDPGALDFSANYEESQGCSRVFQDFLNGLADEVFERCDLQGQAVLEVGCGKGEFLESLADRGVSRCIGYDPAFDPNRVDSALADKLEIFRTNFDDDAPEHDVRLSVVRHTLEHVVDPVGLLSLMSERTPAGSWLLVEVPDWGRIARDAAFWDVYYEHCNYFSVQSLYECLERSGWSPIEVRLVYAGQYLVALARNRDKKEGNPIVPDRNFPSLDEFSDRAVEKIRYYRSQVHAGRSAIWAAGSKAVSFLSLTEAGDEICALIDINPHKTGRFIPGCTTAIGQPDALLTALPDTVFVMNPIYLEEIRADIQNLGLTPTLVGVS